MSISQLPTQIAGCLRAAIKGCNQLRAKRCGARGLRRLGQYTLLRKLGAGGMGEVYEAERDGRSVALKMLPQEPGQQDFLKWFGREARALSALSHPNIVKFHEAGEYNGRPFMVLDYIEGDDTVWERGPMERLARERQLGVFKHPGFWQCMDTLRDRNLLETHWQSGRAPWKAW